MQPNKFQKNLHNTHITCISVVCLHVFPGGKIFSQLSEMGFQGWGPGFRYRVCTAKFYLENVNCG